VTAADGQSRISRKERIARAAAGMPGSVHGEGAPIMTTAAARRAPEPVLYKIPEVMAMLRMSRGALYHEISAGRLRKVKRGRSVFVTAAAIADYVALLEQETEATAG
jgi:predicted DNA-binding transcriptional regulator AlpA